MVMALEPDIAPMAAFEAGSISPATTGAAAGPRRRRGLLGRMTTMMHREHHYSPVGIEQGLAPGRTPEMAPMAAPVVAEEGAEKPRRGWLRRWLVPQEFLHRQRWNSNPGGASRLAGLSRSLRWKRMSGLAVSGWASALLDTVAFRVMYVLEAVVLVLGLSCFFCCCGCQI